jgi:hypothetical protein
MSVLDATFLTSKDEDSGGNLRDSVHGQGHAHDDADSDQCRAEQVLQRYAEVCALAPPEAAVYCFVTHGAIRVIAAVVVGGASGGSSGAGSSRLFDAIQMAGPARLARYVEARRVFKLGFG